ncbi:MAG: 50S ribosomal protein L21 [Nitrospirota bacterium]
MYAIIENSGRQYRVSPNDTIKVERLSGEKGTEVNIEKVLLISRDDKVTVGMPYVEGASVKAEIDDSGKSRKVLVYKKRPRKVYEKLIGHRQHYTLLKIKEIVFGG